MTEPITAAKAREMAEGVTPGQWNVWEGPLYVGGGADLCIGQGDKWLANMDHREPRCPQINEHGHDPDACDICTIDADGVTDEQRSNARWIAWCGANRLAICDALDELETLREEIQSMRSAMLAAHDSLAECGAKRTLAAATPWHTVAEQRAVLERLRAENAHLRSCLDDIACDYNINEGADSEPITTGHKRCVDMAEAAIRKTREGE